MSQAKDFVSRESEPVASNFAVFLCASRLCVRSLVQEKTLTQRRQVAKTRKVKQTTSESRGLCPKKSWAGITF